MATDQAKVAIVGGDPIIGGALEALLQMASYRARFLPEFGVDELGELLSDSQLLLVAPVLSDERRKVLQRAKLGLATPVLELLAANGGDQPGERKGVLFWPCSMEELKRAIDAALLKE